MIRNFGDHAANERTFLAWVRTAIAVMAFGFLVERFNLFLRIAAAELGAVRVPGMPPGPLGQGGVGQGGVGQGFGHAVGLAVIGLGTLMIVLAAARFVRLSRAIDSAELRSAGGIRTDLALALVLVVLSLALAAYLSHALIGPV